MVDRQLGWVTFEDPDDPSIPQLPIRAINTRTSLWPERWPAIALQTCIDAVEASPPDERSMVKFNLPCHTCTEASRCLNAKAKELGPLLYDREILTTPRSSESTLFPRELFTPMLNRSLSFQRSYWKPEGQEHRIAVAQAWDLAWSERIGGDYLVNMTAAVDTTTGKSQLLQIERWQRKTFDEQCRLIEMKWRQYRADLVVVEGDAAQKVWSQHLASSTNVPVLPHTAGDKRNLATGVPSLLIRFQNKKWEFPAAPGGWQAEEMDNMLVEFESFGWEDGKLQGVGEHDDTVMCFWHLDWAINSMLIRAVPLESHVGVQSGRYN